MEEGKKIKEKPIDLSYKQVKYEDNLKDDYIAKLRN